MVAVVTEGLLPREKLEKMGAQSLADAELISLIIGSGVKGSDYKKIANRVVTLLRQELEQGGDLRTESVAKIYGLGYVKASKIIAGIEIGRRLYGIDETRKKVTNSEEVYRLCKNLTKKKQEHLVGIYLNARYELLGQRTVNIGTINRIDLLPRDVLLPALELNAISIIVAHNHPSGDLTPSKEDINMTIRLKQASEIIGLTFLDHIIVTQKGWRNVPSC